MSPSGEFPFIHRKWDFDGKILCLEGAIWDRTELILHLTGLKMLLVFFVRTPSMVVVTNPNSCTHEQYQLSHEHVQSLGYMSFA